MKSIAIVLHKYLPQPDVDLITFLNKKKNLEVVHIFHSIPDASDRKSFYEEYLKGKLVRKSESPDFKLFPEFLVLLKNIFYTSNWLISTNRKWEVYIGMDGLSAVIGMFLKGIGRVKKVIYWSIDFVPSNRFDSFWKNYIYRLINIFACKNADEVWDLSPRMAEGRKKYFGIMEKDYKSHKIVPYGLWTHRIKRVPYTKCQKNTLVFMGHLLPKQGIDIVLRKIPNIVKKIPGFKFKIIGSGSYERSLRDLVDGLRVGKYCEFLGRIDNPVRMEQEIAKSAVAIAPYKKMKDNYSYYADPGKVKTYLACGVPVLLTSVPWNALEIQKKKCGLVIKDNGSDLVEKLLTTMKPSLNEKFRENAVNYSTNFDYESIFSVLNF